MGNYRKRPVLVEAFQVRKNNMIELADWCEGSALRSKPSREGEPVTYSVRAYNADGSFAEAPLTAWLIRDVNGTYSALSDTDFMVQYKEIVEEPPA